MSKILVIDSDNVIQQIAEILAEAEGDFIEHIANQVLGHKVTYKYDSQFEMLVLEEDDFVFPNLSPVKSLDSKH